MIKLSKPIINALDSRVYFIDENTGTRYFLEIEESSVQLYVKRQSVEMAVDMDYYSFDEPKGQSYYDVMARCAIQKSKKICQFKAA